MNKTVLIIITLGLLVTIGIIFLGDFKTDPAQAVQNSEIKNGIQYIKIDAQGGYFPKVSNAKADMPTKLIVKTYGTYDCSSSLVINSINYQKMLPQKGETEIDIGIPKAGVPLQGVCGMGMYSFLINFS